MTCEGDKLCRKYATKGDLNKDEINAYQQCMDWAAKLEAQKYLIKHKDSSDTPGSQRRYLWELSQDGRNFFKQLNGDF